MMLRVPGSSTSSQNLLLSSLSSNAALTGEQFLEDLKGFLSSTGQKFGTVTHFNGRPLQLQLLYNAVVTRGGWQKVGQQNSWEEVAHILGLPRPCVNAGHALKAIYYQCLLKYECAKFNRTPVEDIYEDDDVFKRFALVGSGFSRIPDYLRQSCGLPNDVKEEDAFQRLQLSLASGLPNEVDFAVNAMLVRSADAHRPFFLTSQRMRLMESLVSTAGVFADHAGHYIGAYNNFIADTDKDFIRYWKDTVLDEDLWDLFQVQSTVFEQPLTSRMGASDLFSNLAAVDSNEIRVIQIATILSNLSLEESNAKFLAANSACLKFSSLCANSRRNAVFELGLQLMTQLSLKIDLPSSEAWVQSVLLKTVHRCLESPDRLRHLLGLSLVGSMCEVDCRRSCIAEVLDEYHCTTISQNLGVPDAPVVIFSLEVMYKLSGMGNEQATLIAENSCNLEFLVRLLSVSAELVESAASDVSHSQNHGDLPVAHTAAQPVPPQNQAAPNTAPISISQQETTETIQWFRSVYDEDDSYAMSMSDVFKDYTAFCTRRKYTPNLGPFNHLYQLAFAKARSANYNLGGKSELCIAGIKRRNPIPENCVPNNFSLGQSASMQPKQQQNGHASHIGPISCSTLPVVERKDCDNAVETPENRQKKTSESSLIRSLLATKINRKQSTGSTDGLYNHTGGSNSNHSLEDWRTPANDSGNTLPSNRSEMSDGIFSDMESNDSIFMTPPAQKDPRSRSSSLVSSDVVAAAATAKPKRKPTVKRQKTTIAGPEVEPAPSVWVNGNGLSNGNSHGFDESRSSTPAAIVVPYVLPEPKPVKKVRPKKSPVDSAVNVLLNGQGGEVVTKKALKTPKRLTKKQKLAAALNGTGTNGLVNGHGEAGTPLGGKQPKRKPTKRKPKLKPGEVGGVNGTGEVGSVGGVAPAVVQAGSVDDNVLYFLCEWEGCQKVFGQNAGAVFKHNFYEHVPSAVEGSCRWPNCNGIKRQTLSLITHLHETHCSPNELLRQAIRRQELRRNVTPSIPPPVPAAPLVAYSEHAALHAIQARYGSAVASDFQPEIESTNTRTLRLTAALVLRNISHFSHVGRIKLYKYEHTLTISAMMQSEASHVVSECLYYLAVHKRDPTTS